MEMTLFNWIVNYNTTLFYWINHGMDNSILDSIMPLITNFGSIVAWGLICGILFIFGGQKAKKVAILGLIALFTSNLIVFILKPLIAEPRPFIALSNVDLLVPEKEIYSFPSGHTTSSFSVATVIGLKYSFMLKNKKYRLIYPLIAFAALIGFSRIYIGVHYPFDVIFGAIIGVICALIILKFENNIFNGKISNYIGLQQILRVNLLDKIK